MWFLCQFNNSIGNASHKKSIMTVCMDETKQKNHKVIVLLWFVIWFIWIWLIVCKMHLSFVLNVTQMLFESMHTVRSLCLKRLLRKTKQKTYTMAYSWQKQSTSKLTDAWIDIIDAILKCIHYIVENIIFKWLSADLISCIRL